MLLGYLRVSTHGGETEEGQRLALRASGVRDVDMMTEMVGGASERPLLGRCLAGLRPGDVLVAASLDRLGRSLSDVIAIVLRCSASGAHLRTLDGAVDTEGAHGGSTFALCAALAQYETSLAREERQARLAIGRRRGGKLPGPAPMEIERIFTALRRGATPDRVCRAFALHPNQLEQIIKMRGWSMPVFATSADKSSRPSDPTETEEKSSEVCSDITDALTTEDRRQGE